MLDFETSEIITVNGQDIRVGWDEYGYFTLLPVERVEVEGEMHEEGLEGQHPISIPPHHIDTVKELMDQGR